MFGTYVAHPSTGEAGLIMGLPPSEKPRAFSLSGLLLLPFKPR
jgi:hypothetical protein